MQLKHLKNNEIDFNLWNQRIKNSLGSFPYAFSWFLDIVSPQWEALVSRDYEYLMPLPVKKRRVFKYLSQPKHTQQLGVFSESPISIGIYQAFVNKIPYLSYQLSLNENNIVANCNEITNYTLSLHFPYETLAKNYSKNTRRNIQNAEKNGLTSEKLIFDEELKEFMMKNSNIHYNKQLDTIFELIVASQKHSLLEIWGIKDSNKNLISTACFYNTTKRLIYVFPVNNINAKTMSASFLLLDSVISKYSSMDIILDFEGSQVEGIARFYKGFGAVNRPYCVIKKFRPAILVGKI